MSLHGAEQRKYVNWFYVKKDRSTFDLQYIDFYGYACIEMNARRALRAKGDVNAYYGYDGWVMLLMHYCRVLEEMSYRYHETAYAVPKQLIEECKKIARIEPVVVNGRVTHYIDLTDKELLEKVAIVAKYIEYMIQLITDIKLDNLEEQIKELEKE